jgi:hypothetical protein
MTIYYNYVYSYVDFRAKFFNKSLICIPDFTLPILICNLSKPENGAVKRA